MRIAVVAIGKIGLPIAVQFADSGHEVVGVDVNQATVNAVNAGKEPFPGEAFIAEKIANLVSTHKLRATTSYQDAVEKAQAVVVVVPLFVNDQTWQPDFTWMDAATVELAKYLQPGTLVSYETTLPVGTTRNRFCPMLEQGSGLVEGKDFSLIFSPERVLTGRVFADIRRYPKLVGGLNELGTKRGIEFYKSVLQFEERDDLPHPNGVWDMGSAEAAELAKIAETTYRDVNIGLANQFAQYADKVGVDIQKVIQACNSQPYSHIHQPGIAVGGHCIPVYPRLYISTDEQATVVRAARLANADMPRYVVSRCQEKLGDLTGKTAVVLGASYRGGVKETAFSGVFATVHEITQVGAKVKVHDPFYSPAELKALGFESYTWGQPADVVIIQADHREYAHLKPADIPGCVILFDGRNLTSAEEWVDVPRITVGGGQ